MLIFSVLSLVLLGCLLSLVWLYRIGGRVFSVLLTVLFIIGEERMHLFSLFGGSSLSPDLPNWLVIAVSWLSGWFLISGFVCLAGFFFINLPLIRTFLLGRGKWIFGLELIFTLGFSIWAGINGLKAPEVLTYEVNSPKGLTHPYRIVQLTDTHISTFTREDFFNSLLEKVNDLKPDLIVITGDVTDGPVEVRPAFTDRLKDLKARDGVLVIPGNHEYYSDYAGWKKYLNGMSFRYLENDCHLIRHGKDTVEIVGVSDDQAERNDLDGPDLPGAMKKCPGSVNPSFKVLLKHRPKNAHRYLNPKFGFDLMLSGHTHGGMVPVLNLLVTKLNSGYLRGWYELGSSRLYISDGTHLWNGFAFRAGTKNTIAVFDIK